MTDVTDEDSFTGRVRRYARVGRDGGLGGAAGGERYLGVPSTAAGMPPS